MSPARSCSSSPCRTQQTRQPRPPKHIGNSRVWSLRAMRMTSRPTTKSHNLISTSSSRRLPMRRMIRRSPRWLRSAVAVFD
jgi:hypothetical protein